MQMMKLIPQACPSHRIAFLVKPKAISHTHKNTHNIYFTVCVVVMHMTCVFLLYSLNLLDKLKTYVALCSSLSNENFPLLPHPKKNFQLEIQSDLMYFFRIKRKKGLWKICVPLPPIPAHTTATVAIQWSNVRNL